MEMFPIPINEKPYYNTDAIANSIAATDMWDCYLEPVPNGGFITRRRPQLLNFTDLVTGVQGDGVFWWDAAQKCIAVSGGRVFNVNQDGTFTDITGDSPIAGIPVIFSDGQMLDTTPWLYLATGKLIYTKNGGKTAIPTTVNNITIVASPSGFAVNMTGTVWVLLTSIILGGYASQITILNNSYNDLSQISVTITGTDINGNAQTETISLPVGGATATSTNQYLTVASITPSSSITPAITTANPTGYASSVTGAVWSLTSDIASDGFAHQVTIQNNTSIDHSLQTATVIGTDLHGNPSTEIINLPGPNGLNAGGSFFQTVTSITPSASIGTDTMSIGWGANTATGSVNIGWNTNGLTISADNVPAATHIDWIDGRFVANLTGTPRFAATDTNPNTGLFDNAFWASTINPFRNTARGDNLQAIRTCWEEIYAWGSQALEVWQNDYVTPFSSIPSALTEVGLEAPYSVCRTENTLFAVCVLDGKRTVVKLAGRVPIIISEPIANILAEMSTVSDAIGDLITVGGVAIYLLNFPTAQQTWAYDHKNDVWCRWGHYNGDSDNRDQFIGQHSCFCKAWNKHLIMSRIDGKIYELTRTGVNDAGTPLIPYRRTGWINMGTDRRKRNGQFYVKCRPGLSSASQLLMRYQDNGRNEWSTYTEMAFEDESIERLTRQGTFRTRRYEFRIPDANDTILVSAEGEFAELVN